GQIHISRVEYLKSATHATKYTSYTPVSALSLQDDYATIISHHETDNSSLLVYASKKGLVTAIDLRSMKPAWSFEPPPHYGQLTSMVCDRFHSWVMAGTHRGVVCLWDVRFSIMVNSWQHPSKTAIGKMDLYTMPPQGRPAASTAKTVCMSVENSVKEISVWDIETPSCYQMWCTMGLNEVEPEANIDGLYGEGVNALPPPKSSQLLDEVTANMSMYTLPKLPGRRTFAINSQLKFMVSGGNDRKLRFHDVAYPEKSFIMSGLSAQSPQPVFNSHPFKNTFFNIEHYTRQQYATSPQLSHRSEAGADLTTSTTPDSHLDAITAITISKRPCDMIVSGSRDGVVKVFL
ncbi:Serine/threonine-protein kinase, partial [Kappamyces sp. JEL0680]